MEKRHSGDDLIVTISTSAEMSASSSFGIVSSKARVNERLLSLRAVGAVGISRWRFPTSFDECCVICHLLEFGRTYLDCSGCPNHWKVSSEQDFLHLGGFSPEAA